MIASLQGALYKKHPPFITIECQGVGYEIELLPVTFYSLPENTQHIKLYIYHLVREESQQLFGFLQEEEREMFRWLLRLSGIGAKSALAIIHTFSWQDLASIINHNEAHCLTKVPGIGKKIAEKLFIDMKNKFPEHYDTSHVKDNGIKQDQKDISQALSQLGYSRTEIEQVIKNLPSIPIDEMLKTALQKLAKKF